MASADTPVSLIDAARAVVKSIYGFHLSGCAFDSRGLACSCGLDALRAAVKRWGPAEPAKVAELRPVTKHDLAVEASVMLHEGIAIGTNAEVCAAIAEDIRQSLQAACVRLTCIEESARAHDTPNCFEDFAALGAALAQIEEHCKALNGERS